MPPLAEHTRNALGPVLPGEPGRFGVLAERSRARTLKDHPLAVLQDGRTIATGTHDELPADDAGYRRPPASRVGDVD